MASKNPVSGKVLPIVVSASLAFGMCPALASADEAGSDSASRPAALPDLPDFSVTYPDSIAVSLVSASDAVTAVDGGAKATYSEGLTFGLAATPTPSNLSTIAAMAECTWASSNESVVTVKGVGPAATATVQATGEADITATLKNATATFHVSVVAGDGSGSDDPINPINPINPSDEKVSLLAATIAEVPSQVFVGLPLTPEVEVTYKGTKLVCGTDYEVTYLHNDEHGLAGVTITGKGDYTGEVVKTFRIYSEVVDVFSDAAYTDWFVSSGALDYSYVHGLVAGYSGDRAGEFGPYDLITRAQVATILWRIAGEPTDCASDAFDDVDYDQYYGPAVTWARATGVINGFSGTNDFGPDANVSREDLCCMLANYANKIAQVDTASDCAKLDSYPDAVTVSDYARESVGWCIDAGLMSGVKMDDGTDDGTVEIQAQGNAWRASMASMTACLHRDVLKLG